MKHNKTNKLLAIFLLGAMLALLGAHTCFAANTGFTCAYEFLSADVTDLKIKITGTADTMLTAYVWADGLTPAQFSAATPPLALVQYELGYGLTAFDETFPLPAGLSTGVYHLKVADKSGASKLFDFEYYNEAEALSALADINTAILQGATQVTAALSTAQVPLLLNAADITAAGTLIGQIFSGRTDQQGNHIQFANTTEFRSLYNEALAIHGFLNRGTSVSATDYLTLNQDKLGVDIQKYYTPLTDAAKTELTSLLASDTGYLTQPFSENFNKLSALAAMKTVQKWQDIKNIITTSHKDVIGITESVSDTTFNKMMDYTYQAFDDISANYLLAKGTTGTPGTPATPSAPARPAGGGGGGGMASIGGSASKMEEQVNPTNEVSFTDVPDGHWAQNQIEYLVQKSVLNGYPDNTFRPTASISRAEFTKLLVTAFGLSAKTGLPFSDIAHDAWYRPYVEAAYGSGIVNGTSDGVFSPDAQITREDACVMIYRILKNGYTLPEGVAAFSDAETVSHYAKEAVGSLSKASIVNGVGDNLFAPALSIDRQSAAAIIYKTMQFQNVN